MLKISLILFLTIQVFAVFGDENYPPLPLDNRWNFRCDNIASRNVNLEFRFAPIETVPVHFTSVLRREECKLTMDTGGVWAEPESNPPALVSLQIIDLGLLGIQPQKGLGEIRILAALSYGRGGYSNFHQKDTLLVLKRLRRVQNREPSEYANEGKDRWLSTFVFESDLNEVFRCDVVICPKTEGF